MTFPVILLVIAVIFIFGGVTNYKISDLFIGKLTKNPDNSGGGGNTSITTDTPPPLTPGGKNPVLKNPVVADAKKYLGIPYKFGGNNPAIGIDCSRFVQLVFADVGIPLKRDTFSQFRQGTPVASTADLQPGDVIFTVPTFKGPDHEGLYVGNGLVQESPHTPTGPGDIEVNKYVSLQGFLSDGLVGIRRYQ